MHLPTKEHPREKIILYYDSIIKGEDPGAANPNFWNEFFLLHPNVSYLEEEVFTVTANRRSSFKSGLTDLFHHCIYAIRDEASLRTANALQTLCALIRGTVKHVVGAMGVEVLNILIGYDRVEYAMKILLERVCEFLTNNFPASLKTLSLKCLLVLITAADNVNQNPFMDYLLVNSVFEALVQILSTPGLRLLYGHDTVLILGILVNYRKYEALNPYIVKLSILDDELTLNGYCQVVSHVLCEYNRNVHVTVESREPVGILSWLGNMFVAEDGCMSSDVVKTDESMLLAMYEAVHLNRNFITTLTNLPTETSGFSLTALLPMDQATAPAPTSLLVSFLTYCSEVMQDLKNERNRNAAKLCMIILTCISEDQYANTLMHDVNLTFKVALYRVPMRHRKAGFEKTITCRPLACAVLDLTSEFIRSHLMRNLPFDLMIRCLGIIHRILCYEKKCRVRLHYTWRELWGALFGLLRFLASQETALLNEYNIFELMQKVVNLLNLFITFGDTFLYAPATYDELYYELIRNAEVFEHVYTSACRHAGMEGAYKTDAQKLCNCMVNIRSILNHFTPKLDVLSSDGAAVITEQQVLDAVKSSYDSLTLKLQENLDVIERYNEKPREMGFFAQIVRHILQETRSRVQRVQVDHKTLLNEFKIVHN